MPEAELPAQHTPGLKIQHDRQVVVLSVDSQVGKVLYPSASIDHATVVHAGLWPTLVAEHGVLLEGIRRHCYLWSSALTVLLASPGNGDTSQSPDASGFGMAPVQLGSQAPDTVAGMFLVYCQ